MKKKKFKKLSLNKDAISDFSSMKGGAVPESNLGVASGCPNDPICDVHPPKELSIASCATKCWSWFGCNSCGC